MSGRKNLIRAAAFAAAMAASTSSVYGAAGILTTTVEPLTDNVTYSIGGSQPMTTYIGYTVSVSNGGGNTINNVVFTGTTTVTNANESAVFSSVEGATCTTTNAGGTSIRCSLGQFPAGRSVSFVVFFVAPIQVVVPETFDDFVTFTGETAYAEQDNGKNPLPNSKVTWTSDPVLLGTENPTTIISAVPKAGGSFYTGAAGISKPNDLITTVVTVPPLAAFTTATIVEDALPDQANCANFVTCLGSQLTINGTFLPFMSVVIREDSANIKKGTKIESVTVVYTDSLNQEHIVGLCASPTTPTGTSVPCIAKRTHYKNKGVQGWTTDLDGDFEWLFIQISNGRFGLL